MTGNQIIGEQLLQLARTLFGEAARRWFSAIGIELAIGVGTAIIALTRISDRAALVCAVIAAVAYAAAAWLRWTSEQQNGLGETLRRQSVLSGALDWGVSPVQVSEWKRCAKTRIVRKAEAKPLEQNYYTTPKPTGPGRLAEMTAESAFYTRYQYGMLSGLLKIVTAVALVLTIVVFASPFLNDDADVSIKTAVIMLLPLLISLDVIGWMLRLQDMALQIKEVEGDIERLMEKPQVNTEQVMRLVDEYNCIVVQGIPILDSWFFHKQKEIGAAWRAHQHRPGDHEEDGPA